MSEPTTTIISDDYFYDVEKLKFRNPAAQEMDQNLINIHCSFGFDSHKRNNIHYLAENVVMTSVGNIITFISLKNGEQTYFSGLRNGGIGAIAVHPSRKLIAVAESHINPLIYILGYPSLKVHRILREGTTKAYSNICFNSEGDKIASVGSEPDYMLTIWNWNHEQVVLRSKAFSQDVYRIAFASDGVLTSSGMGHIKFWNISSTFTGLKLQGYLGKFGATELTDISAFIQMPDGKISNKGKKPCHQGRIEVVMLVEGEVFTAAEDGYVRMWDLETIDSADVTTSYSNNENAAPANAGADRFGSRIYEMEPSDEILIGKDVKIKTMIRNPDNGDEFLIQDSQGYLFKLDLKRRVSEKILKFHSGPIVGACTSPVNHSVISLGTDGTLRLFDYIEKKQLAQTVYQSNGTYIKCLPQILDGTGCTVVAGFADGVLRIISHDQLKKNSSPSFTLQYVFKPHKLPIVNIEISEDGKFMATTSSDCTVFFFKILNSQKPATAASGQSLATDMSDVNVTPFNRKNISIVPLGFIQLESLALTISFSPDNHTNKDAIEDTEDDEMQEKDQSEEELFPGRRILATLENGLLYSMILPPSNEIDCSVTFEISLTTMNFQPWEFSVPEYKIEKKKEPEQKEPNEKTAAEGSAPPEEEVAIPIIRDMLMFNAKSPIRLVHYLDGGYFIVVVINQRGHSEVRVCKFGVPGTSRLLYVHEAEITDLKITSSGKYILFGAANGLASLRKLRVEEITLKDWKFHEKYNNESKTNENISDFEEIFKGAYWINYAHDSERGKVTSISSAFDDSFLVSVGQDGGFIVWRNNMDEITRMHREKEETEREATAAENSDEEEEIEEVKRPATAPSEIVDDITDPQAYTIQEGKIKSERDKEVDDAEKQKQITRNNITELRNEFLRILAENDSAPNPMWRLPRDSFSVDADLRTYIEKETEEKIENVRKDLQWASERETIGLQKLKRKFLDDISTERVEIKAFRCNHKVATFRTCKLISMQDLSNIQSLIQESSPEKAVEASDRQVVNKGTVAGKEKSIDKKAAAHEAKSQVKHDSRSKLEARKLLRAQRAQEWKELMDTKPDENYEDPKDVAAIRYAESHMGDYKLKTGERYIVPESERVDADKKKRQLILLNESIFGLKENFNAQILSLRDTKLKMILKFQEYIGKISALNKELSLMGETVDALQKVPQMDLNAYPESRYHVTEQDIIKYLENHEHEQAASHGIDDGGFGGLVNTTAKVDTVAQPEESQVEEAEVAATVDFSKQSRLEAIEFQTKLKTLKYRKKRYLNAIERSLLKYDEKVESLVKDRILLDGDIKFAEIKLLLLFREWVLLKEFEKYDTKLAEKLIQKRQEQDDIDVKEKLNSKKFEIEQVIRKEKEIQEDFSKTLGEGSKHEEYLTKVLRKKIKRAKKRVKAEGSGDKSDEEEEEESEDDYDDFNDSDLSEEEEEEKCPYDCDPAIFNKVLEMRERKLDLEDALMEIQKQIEALKKENESLIKKEKVINVALKNTEDEIQDFQTQKQQKLNELDVVVPLRLHQLQYLEKNSLAADLSSALVFVEDGLRKLKNRIKELHQEKADIKRSHKGLKKNHVSLNKSRKEKQSKLEDLEGRAYDVQMLKFGKIIDLEKLERMGVNKNADELREKLQKEDRKRMKELEEAEMEIANHKERLTEVITKNTERLEKLVSLTEQSKRLENALNESQSSVTAEYNGPQKKDTIERQRLINLVQVQNGEIDDLKTEIELLIRKPIRQGLNLKGKGKIEEPELARGG